MSSVLFLYDIGSTLFKARKDFEGFKMAFSCHYAVVCEVVNLRISMFKNSAKI